jgi:glycogen(starch) synthase
MSDPPTVVSFVITRAATRNINVAALQNQLMFDDLKHTCTDIESGLGQRILSAVSRGRLPSYEELLSKDAQVRIKRAMHAMKNNRLPLIVTHDLIEDGSDPILRHLRHRNLFNAQNDPVKVVFHPEFVTATSPLLSLDYDQFVRGCHLGIFPSYYEPWGYTPLECIALGQPAVTTDLSGFGTYVQNNVPNSKENGIYVMARNRRTPDQSIDELTDYLYAFVQLNRRERIELRNRAERLSDRFDWSVLARHYHQAHDHALQNGKS